MSKCDHFHKKFTFYFASRECNFGSLVMKLNGEEVNIVTYLQVLKLKSFKNQVFYGQKIKKKSKNFDKIEKNPNFFF